MTSILEVQVNTDRSRRVFFRPLGRALRGPADFSTARSKSDFDQAKRWPERIPGQVLGINFQTGEKYIREPLHDSEQITNKQRIEGRGLKLPPIRELITSESVGTWLYWIKNGVRDGHLKITAGEIPPESEWPDKPRRSFIRNENTPQTGFADAIDRLTAAIELQTKLFARILETKSR
jgi:hypothetical protein